MKVHPAPKKRNVTLHYDVASSRQKKLRRLPHIFEKVLELPFPSNADVFIEETPNSFRFVVSTDDVAVSGDIRAHAVEIHPGVTKIVIRGTQILDLCMDELALDLWRFRLPASTLPELATAAYAAGEMVVMVPKDVNFVGENGVGDVGAKGWLVLAQ